MNNTTPDAIYTAIETLIDGLTPSGGTTVGENTAYAVIEDTDYNEDPTLLDEVEIDRQYMLHGLFLDEVVVHAQTTHNQLKDELVLAIGHQMADFRDSRDRRDKDLRQIQAQLIRIENRPAGVLLIKFKAGDKPRVIRQGTYWWTVLRFECQYYIDPDYGG